MHEIKKIIDNNNLVDFKRSGKMNFKRKLLFILISFSIIIPFNAFAYSKYLIPGGENIGIKVSTTGAYVVGFYKVNNEEIAKKAGFMIGDRIVSINDEKVDNVLELVKKITSEDDFLNLSVGVIRNNELKTINLNLTRDSKGGYKTGLYVKDSITGIGTLTFIDPDTKTFGALGHEIADASSDVIFEVNDGNVFQSTVTSVTRSSVGKPGEKNAKLNNKLVYGTIDKNLETGIFGKFKRKINDLEKLEVAEISEVKIGNAEIITVLDGNKKEHYKIEILSIDKNNPTKNFLIKIVDDRLLNKTGGIVKGMSGSPIIQNGKIIGAITHTLVDNPKKGYGISIIKMLESIE